MADEVRVQLMGPIRAWRNGETVELRGVSSRTVLACLALSPGATVPIETLCDALWGDSAPPNATGNVQATISRLRRGLGRASIDRVPGGYRLEDGTLTDAAEIVSIIDQVSTGTMDDASTRLR